VNESWVLNASPTIVLARIGLQGVFFDLTQQVLIPQAVAKEIQAGPPEDAAQRFLAEGRISIVPTPPPSSELSAWDLGAGETAVLSYALANPGWIAILDDGAARKCARSFSIPHKGTLAIVLLAKQQGLISSAANTLRALQSNGFRLDDELIRETLHRVVKEEW
jgi:predicted nucleic acid-binding protein